MTSEEINEYFRVELNKALRQIFLSELERLKQEGEHEIIQEAESQGRVMADSV